MATRPGLLFPIVSNALGDAGVAIRGAADSVGDFVGGNLDSAGPSILVAFGIGLPVIVLGVLAVRAGRAFRNGGARGLARHYFTDAPLFVRNWAFAYEPFGWSAIATGILIASPVLPDMVVVPVAAFATVVLLAGFVVGLRREIRPPERAKPKWIRDREHHDAA